MRRANRVGCGYQPILEEQEEPEEIREEGELEIETAETEVDSVIMRGDHLPIVDLSKYNTEGKEAHYSCCLVPLGTWNLFQSRFFNFFQLFLSRLRVLLIVFLLGR